MFTIEESEEVADQVVQEGASEVAVKQIKDKERSRRMKVHVRRVEREQQKQARVDKG